MLLLLAFLLLPQAPADTIRAEGELPAVSVTATRSAVKPSSAPARITLLNPREAETFGARSVADVLDARSTALIRRYGPAGLASISLRGTSASQTLILLDGNRIADPQLGQLDLSLLPTILLDRVEVMHGAASALHGTDGLGGVVNLQTIQPETNGLDARVTFGAFGERVASGRAAVSTGAVRAVVAAEASRFEGDFPYFNPNLGQEGGLARRLGADRRLLSLFGRVEADLGPATLHGAIWAGSADTGVPGSIGTPSLARQQDEHLRAWGGVRTRAGSGTLHLSGLVQRSNLTYQSDTGRATLASVEAEARIPGDSWMLSTGATLGYGTADHPSLDAEAAEFRLGAFAAATKQRGRLLIYPAIRADVYTGSAGAEETLAAVSPRIGLNWQPAPGLPVHLKAGLGSAFRAPTFNDRYWRYGAGTDAGGDPNLRPERGWTADVGVSASAGAIDLEATVYRSTLTDQIVWAPGVGGLFSAFNIGKTRTLGAELTADLSPIHVGAATLTGGATYAYTDARDATSEPSTQLRYVPRHAATAHATVSTVLTAVTAARAGAQLRYVGRRPVRTDGSLLQPSHLVADLTVGIRHRINAATAHLDLGIENLFDTDYAMVRGYPMPPRHARLSLRISL